jgi:hypothetical protein
VSGEAEEFSIESVSSGIARARESIPPEEPDVEVCPALADLAVCVGDLADAVTDLANEVLRGRWGAHPTYSR